MTPATAETLMTTEFHIQEGYQPAMEALNLLSAEDHKPLVIVDEQQHPLGLITAKGLLSALLDPASFENKAEMATLAQEVAQTKTCKDVVTHVPLIPPESTIAQILEAMVQSENNNAIVYHDGVAKGVLLTTDLFQAVAGVSLTHETKGIHLKDEQ